MVKTGETPIPPPSAVSGVFEMLTSGRRASRVTIEHVLRALKSLVATDPITFNEVTRLAHDEGYQVAFSRTATRLGELGFLVKGVMSAEVREVTRCAIRQSAAGLSELVDPRTGQKVA